MKLKNNYLTQIQLCQNPSHFISTETKTKWLIQLFKVLQDWAAELGCETKQATLVHLTFQFCSNSLKKCYWHFQKKWPVVLQIRVSLAMCLHVNCWWIFLVLAIAFSSTTEVRPNTFMGHQRQSNLLLLSSLHFFGCTPSILALLWSSCLCMLSFIPFTCMCIFPFT